MKRRGEMIDLRWDGTPDYYAVRGHVPFDAAIAEVQANLDDDEPEAFRVTHRWARWTLGGLLPDGCTHGLTVYPEKARGRFPVTILEDAAEVARRERAKADEAAGRQRITALALERWPGIEIVSALGGWLGGARALAGEPPYQPCVRFRFPGGAGRASWAEGDDHVCVERRDLEAWRAFADAVRRAGGGA